MSPEPRLYLVTPVLTETSAFAPALAEACRATEIAAVLLRFAPADERSLVNAIKALAPIVQEGGAAALVASVGAPDLVASAFRGGADGVHCGSPDDLAGLRSRLRDGRVLGAAGLRTRHDAMQAGEAGVDYVMFGEPRPDGWTPPLDEVVERASWWAEIFETPCVAFAPSLESVSTLAATGAEFVALGDAVWLHQAGPAAALDRAVRALRGVAEVAT